MLKVESTKSTCIPVEVLKNSNSKCSATRSTIGSAAIVVPSLHFDNNN